MEECLQWSFDEVDLRATSQKKPAQLWLGVLLKLWIQEPPLIIFVLKLGAYLHRYVSIEFHISGDLV